MYCISQFFFKKIIFNVCSECFSLLYSFLKKRFNSFASINIKVERQLIINVIFVTFSIQKINDLFIYLNSFYIFIYSCFLLGEREIGIFVFLFSFSGGGGRRSIIFDLNREIIIYLYIFKF